MPSCFEIVLQIIIQNMSISHAKRQIFTRAPNFFSAPLLLQSRTPQIPSQNTHQNIFFTEQLPVAASKCQLFFLKREKQEQFFIPPLCLMQLKSCDCIKIKTFSFIILEKLLQSINQFFNMKYKKPLYVCFLLLFIFSFKFLQTLLIIKESIKHESKFNRKVSHNRGNSEDRFSEF